jgi:hypothetical protein
VLRLSRVLPRVYRNQISFADISIEGHSCTESKTNRKNRFHSAARDCRRRIKKALLRRVLQRVLHQVLTSCTHCSCDELPTTQRTVIDDDRRKIYQHARSGAFKNKRIENRPPDNSICSSTLCETSIQSHLVVAVVLRAERLRAVVPNSFWVFD